MRGPGRVVPRRGAANDGAGAGALKPSGSGGAGAGLVSDPSRLAEAALMGDKNGSVAAVVAPAAAAAAAAGRRRWRCAPWLERSSSATASASGGSSGAANGGKGAGAAAAAAVAVLPCPPSPALTEVWPKELTGAAAAAALRRGGPVALRGTRLSACRLAAPAPAPAASGNGDDAADDADDDDDGDLPSVWQAPSSAAEAAPPVVLASPARRARFMRCDAAKNGPGSFYEVRRPADHGGAPLAGVGALEWAHRCATASGAGVGGGAGADAHKLLLWADVCAWELPQSGGDSGSDGAGCAARVRPNGAVWADLCEVMAPSAATDGGAAADDGDGEGGQAPSQRLAAGLLDWPQLQLLLRAGGWAPRGAAALQAGPAGCLLPARYEAHDALIVQLQGRRRVLLVPPEQVGLCLQGRPPRGEAGAGREQDGACITQAVNHPHSRLPPPALLILLFARPQKRDGPAVAQAFRGAAPYPVAHPFDGHSCVSFEEPETEFWPRASEARKERPCVWTVPLLAVIGCRLSSFLPHTAWVANIHLLAPCTCSVLTLPALCNRRSEAPSSTCALVTRCSCRRSGLPTPS